MRYFVLPTTYRQIPITTTRTPTLIPSNSRPSLILPALPVFAPVGATVVVNGPVVGDGTIELKLATDDDDDLSIATDAPLTFPTAEHGDIIADSGPDSTRDAE